MVRGQNSQPSLGTAVDSATDIAAGTVLQIAAKANSLVLGCRIDLWVFS